ncbi:MAG TPA: universal stress protein [Candidatus Obscuribacterales bacterium]
MKVIIAIDGSECSLAALESVVDRPWPQDAEFRVLSVVEPPTPGYAEWHTSYVPYLDEAQQELVKEINELVDERVEFLRREFPHNPVDGKVVEGNIRDSIVREATEWNADFVILGSHGRRGFQKFLLGSVAEAVVSRAPCSVEIIRTPARKAEAVEDESVSATARSS